MPTQLDLVLSGVASFAEQKHRGAAEYERKWFGLDICAGLQAGSNGPPNGGEQIDCRDVDALSRGNEAANASGLPCEQSQKPVLAGASDTQAMQPDAGRTRVRENLFRAGHLAVGEDQDVTAVA